MLLWHLNFLDVLTSNQHTLVQKRESKYSTTHSLRLFFMHSLNVISMFLLFKWKSNFLFTIVLSSFFDLAHLEKIWSLLQDNLPDQTRKCNWSLYFHKGREGWIDRRDNRCQNHRHFVSINVLRFETYLSARAKNGLKSGDAIELMVL